VKEVNPVLFRMLDDLLGQRPGRHHDVELAWQLPVLVTRHLVDVEKTTQTFASQLAL
jgi:hypothetical protein